MEQALAYLRVSTEEQAEEGVSLDAQEERIRAYCMAAGLALGGGIREEGVSGKVPLAHRPGGAELLTRLEWGEAAHVVALKLDRLFRDAEDCLHQTKVWDKAGVGLHLVDLGGQSLNTKSAMGRLFLTLAAAFAELERNLTSERTVQALAHKKANGSAYGPTPCGFRREGARLIPHPDELATVRQIRQLHWDGWSLRQMASELNRPNGKRWYASTVRYILRNDLYAEVI